MDDRESGGGRGGELINGVLATWGENVDMCS